MSKTVEFYFDVGSPSSYLAYTQLPTICDEAGAALIYRPMLLGGVFKATGNASPKEVPLKAHYSIIDLARCAQRYGVPMTFNPHFPFNTLSLMRAITGVQRMQPDRLIALLDLIFTAMWVDGRDFNNLAVIDASLKEGGFDSKEVLGWVNDPAVKDTLRTETEAAVARGVFGAPCMFVGDELFWGQDRLDFVEAALSR